MKSLIIGAGGFVGQYLTDELLADAEADICVTSYKSNVTFPRSIRSEKLDVRDENAILSLIDRERPQMIFNLAAISSVKMSWDVPQTTIGVSILGTLNLLEALRKCGLDANVLLVGSSEEYGFTGRHETLLKEDMPLLPGNIYAAAKCMQTYLGSIYAKAYGMHIVMARAFNHIGAGQKSVFVASDFCRQVAMIEAGLQAPIIKVGNLNAKRDFCDVRDLVKGYIAIINTGKSGEVYNIGSGKDIAISEVLRMILSLTKVKIEIVIDPERFRPIDIPSTRADIQKIQSVCGWTPCFPLSNSLENMLNYWRHNVMTQSETTW